MGQENPLEREMATHSNILAWKFPWTEEPGRLQSMGLKRVGHNWVTEQAHHILVTQLPVMVTVLQNHDTFVKTKKKSLVY